MHNIKIYSTVFPGEPHLIVRYLELIENLSSTYKSDIM